MKVKKLIEELSMYDPDKPGRAIVHLNENRQVFLDVKVLDVSDARDNKPGILINIEGKELDWLLNHVLPD